MPQQMSSRRYVPQHLPSGFYAPRHLPSGRGVSGYYSFWTQSVGKSPPDDVYHGICLLDEECQGICHPDAARVFQMRSVKANVVRTACAIASAFWMRSARALILPDAECQNKYPPDDAHHGICIPDEECQCILLQDTARVLQMQSVKANVVQTMCAMASAFGTRSVRALFLPDAECQGKCSPDDARYGICLPDEECQGIIPSRRRVSTQMSSR